MKYKKNKMNSKPKNFKHHHNDQSVTDWDEIYENVDKFSYKRGRLFEKAKDRTKKFKSRKYDGMDLEQYF
jgi:hypothetical protein